MAGIQYNDLIRTDDGRQTMRNHDDGAFFCQNRKSLLDQGFILGIGEGCGLVQNDDRSIFENRSCQSHALLFAAGKVGPFRPDDRIHPVRKFFKDVIALRCGESSLHFIPRCVRSGGAYIFKDTRFKQTVVLEDEGYPVHQHMRIGLANVNTAHCHASGTDVPEPRD